ncbi:MAG TPA: hypothetical protein VL068_00170, partial [Microthrixaceae bacterium]|nr:hypothetical protein [Microthrixaceae bacterium]
PQTKHPLPPTTGSNGKPPSATHRSYTEEQRESIGLELVRRIIGSEDNRVHDLRKQAGVGADAVDDLERFFELKVSGGGEPDKITLEPSQVARALTDPNFFLVIVSGVEQDAADVSVRFIHSPVELLAPTEKTKLEFSGIRTATSVVFSAKKVSETESSEDPDDSEGVE